MIETLDSLLIGDSEIAISILVLTETSLIMNSSLLFLINYFIREKKISILFGLS
jgi:hypothetical protein